SAVDRDRLGTVVRLLVGHARSLAQPDGQKPVNRGRILGEPVAGGRPSLDRSMLHAVRGDGPWHPRAPRRGAYSGMLPCLRLGRLTRLVRRARSAPATLIRVCD